MISQVTIENFKRFKAPTEFVLKPDGVTFLAGGNNSGKSTLLQALAVWEFARSVIEVNKGKAALLDSSSGQGVGVSAEEFSPVVLPNLKHLWSNLKVTNGAGGGYTLRIRYDWQTVTDPPTDRHLEFGFALANDRLFLKHTTSNLIAGDSIPRMAYLPPFAGITSREERMSPAARKRWIGRGLAGAVLRNLLYDAMLDPEAAWFGHRIGLRFLKRLTVSRLHTSAAYASSRLARPAGIACVRDIFSLL